MYPLLLAIAFAANPVAAEQPTVIVAWKPGHTEAALRQIERVNLKIVEVTGDRAVCRGAQSSATVAVQLRHEPEFRYAFADIPCPAFMVAWRGSKTDDALKMLKQYGVKPLHRGETLPFAVCEGPLTAEIQEFIAQSRIVEAVEPEMIPPPEPKK